LGGAVVVFGITVDILGVTAEQYNRLAPGLISLTKGLCWLLHPSA